MYYDTWAMYPANCRSPRTRANSVRIRQQFADIYTPPNSGERSPEYAERSPEFGGVRSSSPGFARTPPRTGERFARKFVRGNKSLSPLTGVRRGSPRTWFAANEVRRERQDWRTGSPKISAICLAEDLPRRTRANPRGYARTPPGSARIRRTSAKKISSELRRTSGERPADSAELRPNPRKSARIPPRTGGVVRAENFRQRKLP